MLTGQDTKKEKGEGSAGSGGVGRPHPIGHRMDLCRWTGEQKGIDGEISPPVFDFPQPHHVPDVMVRSTWGRGLELTVL